MFGPGDLVAYTNGIVQNSGWKHFTEEACSIGTQWLELEFVLKLKLVSEYELTVSETPIEHVAECISVASWADKKHNV